MSKHLELFPETHPEDWTQVNGAWIHKDCSVGKKAKIYDGIFRGGRFYGGEFCGGEFRRGKFYGGEFYSGEFYGGEFYSGIFCGRKFYGGEFYSGRFYDGEFYDGIFLGGKFYGGEFRGGKFYGGEFYSGEFRSGEFCGGEFCGGIFHGGQYYAGRYAEGVFYKSPLQILGKSYPVVVFSGNKVQVGHETLVLEKWEDWKNSFERLYMNMFSVEESEEISDLVENALRRRSTLRKI